MQWVLERLLLTISLGRRCRAMNIDPEKCRPPVTSLRITSLDSMHAGRLTLGKSAYLLADLVDSVANGLSILRAFNPAVTKETENG